MAEYVCKIIHIWCDFLNLEILKNMNKQWKYCQLREAKLIHSCYFSASRMKEQKLEHAESLSYIIYFCNLCYGTTKNFRGTEETYAPTVNVCWFACASFSYTI